MILASPLRDRIEALRAERPATRIRDLAAALGVSEFEAVLADPALEARALRPDAAALLHGLAGVGPVMALTRNASAVHEKTGCYGNVSIQGRIGLVLNEAIDLRLFLDHWVRFLAVHDPAKSLSSIQVFAPDGGAVHKVYARDTSDRHAWDALVAGLVGDVVQPPIRPPAHGSAPRPDEAVDVAGFRAAWDAMTDTHQFFGLLRRFGVARTQALRLAGAGRARPVGTGSLSRLLHHAAATGLAIMVFVGNPGAIQIHTGPVRRIKPTGPWINVLDPDFNLHLREDHVIEAWLVRKPTEDGVVTSLELFDAKGETIALLFGRRKPGEAEDPAWRDYVEALPGVSEPVDA